MWSDKNLYHYWCAFLAPTINFRKVPLYINSTSIETVPGWVPWSQNRNCWLVGLFSEDSWEGCRDWQCCGSRGYSNSGRGPMFTEVTEKGLIQRACSHVNVFRVFFLPVRIRKIVACRFEMVLHATHWQSLHPGNSHHRKSQIIQNAFLTF